MKLFVANFPSSTRIGHLFKLFTSYGEVDDVKIWRNRKTGRRWGIVEMEEENDAELAINALDEIRWRGKRLEVREASFESDHAGA